MTDTAQPTHGDLIVEKKVHYEVQFYSKNANSWHELTRDRPETVEQAWKFYDMHPAVLPRRVVKVETATTVIDRP